MTKNKYLKVNKELLNGSKLLTLNLPNFVYLPLVKNGEKLTLLKSIEDEVKEGEIIAQNDTKTYSLLSTISGKIKSVEEECLPSGEFVLAVKIENNFKSVEPLKKLVKPSDSAIKTRILEGNITQLFGVENGTEILIDGMETKTTLGLNNFLIKNHLNQILKGTNLLKKAFNLEHIKLMVNKDEKQLINEGIEKLNLKGLELVNHAKKFKDTVLSLETVLNLYNAVEHGDMANEKFVAVAGLSAKNPSYYLVKIGTSMEELIELTGGLRHTYEEIENYRDNALMALHDEVELKKEIKLEENEDEREKLLDLLKEKKHEAREHIFDKLEEHREKYALCLSNIVVIVDDKIYPINQIKNSVASGVNSVLFLSNREHPKHSKKR
ncbi:MAG: hypothetical protein AB7S44_02300 [Spirochaetales bacterium]